MRAFIGAAVIAALLAVGGAEPVDAQEGYALGPGDIIRVTVFGEPDLSGEFEVGADGVVSLPLVGAQVLSGLSVSGAETVIERELAAGFIQNPDVAIDILNYRPFFVIGEVNNQGVFPFIADLTVLKAVAIAGGFTYRADEEDIVVKRAGSEEEVPIGIDELVNPGDVIIVEERWF